MSFDLCHLKTLTNYSIKELISFCLIYIKFIDIKIFALAFHITKDGSFGYPGGYAGGYPGGYSHGANPGITGSIYPGYRNNLIPGGYKGYQITGPGGIIGGGHIG